MLKMTTVCENDIKQALKLIGSKVEAASLKRPLNSPNIKPRLVAVSKTKPKEAVISAYNCGQRHFGENYVQELVDKSNDAEILQICKDIKWHFIGNLQSNKVKKVASVPGLFLVETVDSMKLATSLDGAWSKLQFLSKGKLNVMVQINTSGEEVKNGAEPCEAVDIAKHIVEKCHNLELFGLMTIGRFDHDLSSGPNPDFQVLIQCREEVCKALGKSPQDLELSMGMSNDFEHAIEMGSTNVRVGSSIFGQREYKTKTSKQEEDDVLKQLEQAKVS